MNKPKFEWVPDAASAFNAADGEDWNLVDAYGCVGWAYKVHYFWRAGFECTMCEFLTLAEASRWVEKQAGLR